MLEEANAGLYTASERRGSRGKGSYLERSQRYFK